MKREFWMTEVSPGRLRQVQHKYLIIEIRSVSSICGMPEGLIAEGQRQHFAVGDLTRQWVGGIGLRQ